VTHPMRYIHMIGTPLAHARSPDLINRVFRDRGEAIAVVKRELGPDDLPAYVADARRDATVIGAIVTTPLKQVVTGYLAARTALVSLLGATNCVRFDQGGWIGANFDGHGFLAALADLGGGDRAAKRVLLVGCGGAGSAIAASLAESGGVTLSLYDVDRAKAAGLAGSLEGFAPRAHVEVANSPEGAFDLVINASPVGMRASDPSPIPADTVADAAILADIVTMPDTALKRAAARLGKPILTGDAMVAGQARLLRRFLLGTMRTEAATIAATEEP
jgi:shikimate dehydrogenase